MSHSSIQQSVQAQIERGDVQMRPRWVFVAMWFSGVVSALAAGVLAVYLVRIASVSLRIWQASTPAYGARNNLNILIEEFPWWLLVVTIGLGVAGLWLLRRYGRLYRYRMSMVVSLFLVIVLAFGVGIALAEPASHGNGEPQGYGRGYNR